MIYSSFADYLSDIETIEGKIEKIDQIIEELEDSLLRLAEKGEVSSYELDSGQSKVNVRYRNGTQIENTITSLERRRERYLSKIYGRRTKLVKGLCG